MTVSMVVYGDPKVGKTWLAASAPRPVLFLDAEAGGMRHVPGPHMMWDHTNEALPAAVEGNVVCSVAIKTFQDIQTVGQWLQMKDCPFKSIVVDSLTEAQSRLVRSISPGRQPRIQDWGAIGRELEDAVVLLRDIVAQENTVPECLVLVCGVEEGRSGQLMPMLQGRMRRILAYKVDVIGRLTMQADESGEMRRLLQLAPDEMTVAGKRDGGILDDWIWDPNLRDICELLDGNNERIQDADDTMG